MASADNEPSPGPAPSLGPPSDFGTFLIVPSNPNRARNARRTSWALVGVGVALSVALAVIAATQTATISAILAVLAGVFQVASVVVTQVGGKPDDNLVRHLTRRFVTLGYRINLSVDAAEAAFREAPADGKTREHTGRLSVELSYTREAVGELLATWRDLNPELFTEKENESNGKD